MVEEIKPDLLFDADGTILGRLATVVAKNLLTDKKVVVINAEKAIITGEPKNIVEKYLKRRRVKNKANPEHSPHWPKRPDLLVKRIIRGMLPYDKPKGRSAFKNLRVYIGFPEGYKDYKGEKGVAPKKKLLKFISINNLCKGLGWNA